MEGLPELGAEVESRVVLSWCRLDFHACLNARGDEIFKTASRANAACMATRIS